MTDQANMLQLAQSAADSLAALNKVIVEQSNLVLAELAKINVTLSTIDDQGKKK
jgi:hypothetical protein